MERQGFHSIKTEGYQREFFLIRVFCGLEGKGLLVQNLPLGTPAGL